MFKPKEVVKLNSGIIVATSTIKELILAWKNEEILPYDKNRGYLGTNATRVEKLALEFSPLGLGTITIARVGNCYQLADAHTRLEAMELVAEQFDTKVLSTEVQLSIVPEKDLLAVYGYLNSGKSHSAAMKITNSDYLIGNMGARIIKESGVELPPNFQQNMWDVILAASQNDGAGSMTNVFQARRAIDNEYIDLTCDSAGKFPVPKFYQDKAVQGLRTYKKIMLEYQSHIPVSAKTGVRAKDRSDLFASPGLFMSLFYDALRNQPIITSRSVTRIGTTLYQNSAEIKELAKTVARRSQAEVNVKGLFRALGINNATPEQVDGWKGVA